MSLNESTISINGQTGNGRSVITNPQRTVNLFPEIMPDGKTISLVGVPGLSLFSTVSTGASDYIRGCHVMNGVLYVVSGNHLYSVAANGVATSLGGLSTSTGLVYMADNNPSPIGGDQLMITDGSYGYIWNISSLTFATLTPNQGGIPWTSGPSTVTMLDDYFIINESAGGGRFWVSNTINGTVWNASNLGGSTALSNTLQAVMSFNKQLWLFGSYGIEVWYDSGYGYPPFTPVSGMTINLGIAAAATLANTGISLVWLGKSMNGSMQVLTSSGGAPQAISTPEIEYQIRQMTTVSDALAFYINHEGHGFYFLSFPTGNMTFVFDFSTKMWHERSSFSIGQGMSTNWFSMNTGIYFNGSLYVGDSASGKLYLMSSANFTDNGNPIVSYRQANAIVSERDYVFHSSLELMMETGVGFDGNGNQEGNSSSITWGGGTDPKVMVQWSDNGGKTWGNEHWVSIGKMGEYGKRVILRRLGKSRNRVYRYMISDPVKKIILDAVLHFEKVAA